MARRQSRGGSRPAHETGQRPSREGGKRGTPVGPAAPSGLEAVYGVHALRALIDRGQAPKILWVQQGQAEQRLEALIVAACAAGAEVTSVSRDVLDQLSGQAAHQGAIGFCLPLVAENETTLWWRLEQWQEVSSPLLLILDGVTDPHNLGACLRSADAAGVHGVIVPKDKSAPLNATVRKVACGAAETVPVFQVTNLARCMDKLKQLGIWITGTAGEATALLFEADFRAPCALVMGAEGKGLRRLTREACDGLVKLPMAGSVSSLNVSVATGICLFEAVRQRHGGASV